MIERLGAGFLARALVVAVMVLAILATATPARAASFTVDDLGDAPDAAVGNGVCADAAGTCTLRAAIEEANALAGDDEIGFAAGLSGTITLVNGELLIQGSQGTTNGLTITGPGRDKLTVSGGDNSRVLHTVGSWVTISDLTIANGQEDNGGGMYLDRGAAGNLAYLTLRNTTLRDNNASGSGGGVYVGEGMDVTVQDSTITGNGARDGGGFCVCHPATIRVQNSTISGNSASHKGGGMYNLNWGQTYLQSSILRGNRAGQGGGMYNVGGLGRSHLEVRDSTVSDNTTSASGGAIVNEGGADALVQNSTISGNDGAVYGGIYNLSIVIYTDETGKPTHLFKPDLMVKNSTITNNGGFDLVNRDGEAKVGNSSIATRGSANDVAGAFTSWGHNLIGAVDGSTGFTNGVNGDKTGTQAAPLDPKLGPLADNGGPTPTHALLSDSPAIDAGDPAFAPPPEFDQRGEGYPRKQHGRLDIGAFEAHVDTVPPRLVLPAAITAEATGPGGAAVTFAATAQDDTDEHVAVSCAPASGSTFALGTTTVTCAATDTTGNAASGSFTVTVRDTTPPVISGVPTDTTKTATSSSGTQVSYHAPTATDVVAGNVPVVCAPPSGSMFPLGTTTVTCSASDTAGNTARTTFAVTVVYAWSGVLKPINPDGSSVFRVGSPVPVKFQLIGESAGITDATAKLYVARVTNGVVGPEVAATSAATASGNLFRYDAKSKQYVFSWATKGLEAGTYQLRIDLGDGTRNTVKVALR